jgi:hypothetical protein
MEGNNNVEGGGGTGQRKTRGGGDKKGGGKGMYKPAGKVGKEWDMATGQKVG